MSLNSKKKLRAIAKELCRELRKQATPAERKLWQHLRKHKLSGKKFYRQYPLFYDIEGRESFFIADFYCHEARLVVEVDGKIHEFNKEYDKHREEILSYLGVKVIRIKNEEIEKDVNYVLEKIKLYLGTPPRPSSWKEEGELQG